MAINNEIRYLNPPTVEVKKKKYCRFKKAHIKYVDYKDAEFLKRFLKRNRLIEIRRTVYGNHSETGRRQSRA